MNVERIHSIFRKSVFFFFNNILKRIKILKFLRKLSQKIEKWTQLHIAPFQKQFLEILLSFGVKT